MMAQLCADPFCQPWDVVQRLTYRQAWELIEPHLKAQQEAGLRPTVAEGKDLSKLSPEAADRAMAGIAGERPAKPMAESEMWWLPALPKEMVEADKVAEMVRRKRAELKAKKKGK